MAILKFPNPRISTPEGIVAIGGDLDPESLILAYSQGIFPWPIEGLPLTWFCPPQRAILEFKHLHISQSLKRSRKKSPFLFTIDQSFKKVIEECAKTPRPNQEGTWITPQIIDSYCTLHKLGHAHSIEVWNETQLVGGLYGVASSGAFAAESMFHHEANASKLAILFLLEHLYTRQLDWIDIQVMTPHMQALGAQLISRDEFLTKLAETQALKSDLF